MFFISRYEGRKMDTWHVPSLKFPRYLENSSTWSTANSSKINVFHYYWYLPTSSCCSCCCSSSILLLQLLQLLLLLRNHHHHHVVPPARIPLAISRHFSLSFIASGRSSGLEIKKKKKKHCIDSSSNKLRKLTMIWPGGGHKRKHVFFFFLWIFIGTCNESDSLTFWHMMTLNRLTCCYNQSLTLLPHCYLPSLQSEAVRPNILLGLAVPLRSSIWVQNKFIVV